ncbi:response regulator [Ramlibacter sp. AW1]|uniref:Response regulator n=1 Tax=Ramlibacter aurantiacus TaxID=2801330 RepID=A0A937D1E4_9BURK|nr:response regulator [Ramlibacter aurantiacus]MBL0420439.1 response regulator [Ramlibacter aurantiacus]
MGITAFIVEDSPAIREALIETLAELADIRTVGAASSERAAKDWLADPAHAWDLAIVDLVLEGPGSGLGVLRALRPRRAGQHVLVLTATASPAVREQCLALGCDAVFDKAMEQDALLAWCAALAGGSPPPREPRT